MPKFKITIVIVSCTLLIGLVWLISAIFINPFISVNQAQNNCHNGQYAVNDNWPNIDSELLTQSKLQIKGKFYKISEEKGGFEKYPNGAPNWQGECRIEAEFKWSLNQDGKDLWPEEPLTQTISLKTSPYSNNRKYDFSTALKKEIESSLRKSNIIKNSNLWIIFYNARDDENNKTLLASLDSGNNWYTVPTVNKYIRESDKSKVMYDTITQDTNMECKNPVNTSYSEICSGFESKPLAIDLLPTKKYGMTAFSLDLKQRDFETLDNQQNKQTIPGTLVQRFYFTFNESSDKSKSQIGIATK